MLPTNTDNVNKKPHSSDDQSGMEKKTEESSHNFDTQKSPIQFGTGKSTESNVAGTRKSGSSSVSQRISASGTSSSSDTYISPISDSFDTYKARDRSSSFDNCRPISLGDSANFDTSGPSSSFDIYKSESIDGDEFDNYKARLAQSFSSDATGGSSLQPCRVSNFDIFTEFGQVSCIWNFGNK